MMPNPPSDTNAQPGALFATRDQVSPFVSEPGVVEIGVIGSPSSTTNLSVNIRNQAAETELVGQMVVATKQMGHRVEYALGTVNEIETQNEWHQNPSMRGLIGEIGSVRHISGTADVRTAEVSVQAVYTASEDGMRYDPSGASLSMSPTTGVPVNKLTDALLAQLALGGEDSVFYPGTIYRMNDVRMPFNTPHFATPRGAYHSGFFGTTGAGKTSAAIYYLAGQLRHRSMAFLIIDPQQQFSVEHPGEVPFSLQAVARLQGRDVRVVSVASEVRLPKDKNLFVELLKRVGIYSNSLGLRHVDNVSAADHHLGLLLEDYKSEHGSDWSEVRADKLLDHILQMFEDRADRIYKGQAGVKKFKEFIQDLRDRPDEVLRLFTPVLSLFAPTAMDGTKRINLWSILRRLNDTGRDPRPYYVLNMSADAFGPERIPQEVREVLDGRPAKALILRKLFANLEAQAEKAYSETNGSQKLNTMVVFDEAARYAPARSDSDEISTLAESLGRYARETRKYGIGWTYILQEPHTLHPEIWAMLRSGFQAFGYGLVGPSIDRMEQVLGSAEPLKLYRAFPNPQSTGRYPFMVSGSVSPLSFTSAPVFLNVTTDFRRFCDNNSEWLPERAYELASLEDHARTSVFDGLAKEPWTDF